MQVKASSVPLTPAIDLPMVMENTWPYDMSTKLLTFVNNVCFTGSCLEELAESFNGPGSLTYYGTRPPSSH
jgi:hypothetical protein